MCRRQRGASRQRSPPEITQGATMPSHDSPAIRARNQGLIAPPPEWGASPEAFIAQAAPVFAGHPGVGARFIGDDQPMGLFLHELLPPAPVISCHIVPVALRAFRAHRRSPGDPRAIRPFVICVSFYMCIRGAAEVRLSHLSNRARHLRPATLPATLPGGCPGPAQSVPPVPRRTPQTAPACRCLYRDPTAGAPAACHRAPSCPRRGVVAGLGSKGRPAPAAHKPLSRLADWKTNHLLGKLMRLLGKLERAMRFELTTPTLARLCSTPELRPLEQLRIFASARCIYANTSAFARCIYLCYPKTRNFSCVVTVVTRKLSDTWLLLGLGRFSTHLGWFRARTRGSHWRTVFGLGHVGCASHAGGWAPTIVRWG